VGERGAGLDVSAGLDAWDVAGVSRREKGVGRIFVHDTPGVTCRSFGVNVDTRGVELEVRDSKRDTDGVVRVTEVRALLVKV
jgi:hypothetical protein